MSYEEFDTILRGLLLNFSFVIMPICLYESLVLDKLAIVAKKVSSLEVAAITGITVILTMAFPVHLFDGHLFDLRMVPILVSLFYGGLLSGTFTIGVMFIYRIYLAGDGIFTMVVVYSFIFIMGFYIAPRYGFLQRKQKLFVSLNITLVAMGLKFFSTYYINMNKDGFSMLFLFKFFLAYAIIQTIAVYLTIHLAEGFIEKRELRMELQRADRMNTVGELAASLAHEIRNPLTVSKGFMQLIELNKSRLKEETMNEYVRIAITEIDRAEGVISDFLSFAKPSVAEVALVNVSDLVVSACKVMTSYATLNDITINTNFNNSCFIYTDKTKLTQVIVNIIKNGIEATPGGGSLDVRVLKHKEHITIEIEDYGIGMTKEVISKLGTPFYTLRSSGTGLGLMVSYKFVQVLGGKIKVESEKEHGSKFSIIFSSKLKNQREKV